MKTSVTLSSPDRNIFGITVRQDSKTGFLSLTDLQDVYDRARINKGWRKKIVSELFASKDNAERIFYLVERQVSMQTGISAQKFDIDLQSFIQEVDRDGLTKVLKKYGLYKTTGARKNRLVWCDSYIWVLFTMEMHPELYANTVIWLTDKLLINRIEAGNFYKGLSSAITKFRDADYIKIAKGLNYLVFNRHEAGIRQTATQAELSEMTDIEKKLAFSIDMGYISSFTQLLEEMRKLYLKKYGNGGLIR